MAKLCADPETTPGPEGLVKALKPELDKIFKPAFLGPPGDHSRTSRSGRSDEADHHAETRQDPAPLAGNAQVARSPMTRHWWKKWPKRCTEVESGARNVDNILTNTLLPDVSRQLLAAFAEGNRPSAIHVSIGENGQFVYGQPVGQVAAGSSS